MDTRRIAALQIGSSPRGSAATVERILAFERDILDIGPDLLVLPEATLGGYPKGRDFGTRVGLRTDAGRTDFLEYWKQSVLVDGPEVGAIAELARRCQCAIVVGIIERAGTTLYCTAVFLSAEGEIAGRHRKLMPTASERLIWGMGDGSTMPVVETPAGRATAAICWENFMPMFRTALYAKGVDVWCAPTVDDRDSWQTAMRYIAYEARSFLVSACQYVPAQDGADEGHDPRPLIRGGSVIVSPLGEVLAGPLYDRVGLVTAEIDLGDVVRARYDFDATGHYARPDVFRLHVDESPRDAVSEERWEAPEED
ncbi:MAG: carbon-nitrogen hydrolase family protein [Gammaproteobacteria bacterium]